MPSGSVTTPSLQAWVGVACVAWCCAVFAPAATFDFVSWDDPLHVTENPLLVESHAQSLREHLLTPALGYPSPITVWSYRIEAWLFGLDSAAPFHVTNVLLHGLIVALVFVLAGSLGLGLAARALAAVTFGLHPIVAEPVCWVSGRKDLLAAALGLGALGLSMHTRLDPRRPRTWLVVATFTCALLAKPVAAYVGLVIPAWALIGCRTNDDDPPTRARAGAQVAAVSSGPSPLLQRVLSAAREALPLWLVTAVVFPIAVFGQAATRSLRTDPSALQLARDAWFALGFHLRLLVGLETPSAKYLPPQWPAPFTPSVDLVPIAALALLGGVTWCAAPIARRRASAGLLFAALSYLPTSNLIPLTRVLADVYVFMPLVGLAWWLGAVLDPHIKRLRPRPAPAVPIVAVGVLCTLGAVPAAARWRNSFTLWSQAYERYPHDYRLCRNVGNARFSLHGPAAGLRQFEECAARFGPQNFERNIGISLAVLGNRTAAKRALQSAAKRDPEDEVVQQYLRELRSLRPLPTPKTTN